MDTQTLSAFVAVAETRSFSQAANQLFITQPAISKRIFNLEEQMGAQLFDRISRTVSLTEAGRTLLPRAKKLLLEVEDTRRVINNLAGNVSGKLSISTSHHISLHRLPPTLRRYSKAFPDVELDLKFTESEKAYDGILNGSIELAIITLSPDPHPQVSEETIWIDELRYSVSADHPLASLDKVTFSMLDQYQAILPERSTFTRQLAEAHFEEENIDLNVIMSTSNFDTIRMMVSIGLGWSLLPNTLIDESLHTLPLSSEPILRPLGVIYHQQRTLSNAAQAFIEQLRQEKRKHE